MVVNNTLRGSIMLSGLTLDEHLRKTPTGGNNGFKHTLQSVTDTEPTVDLEEDEHDSEEFAILNTPESLEDSFAAVSLEDKDDDAKSLPSVQAPHQVMTNSSMRSTRSNRSTRSSGSRSAGRAQAQQSKDPNSSSSQLMMAPKSPYALRRSHTTSHAGVRPQSTMRMRDTSERIERPNAANSRRGKMRRSRSVDHTEPYMPPSPRNNNHNMQLQKEPSLKFSGHGSFRMNANNMHSSFMFTDAGEQFDDLMDNSNGNNNLNNSHNATATHASMDRIGEFDEAEMEDMQALDLSQVDHSYDASPKRRTSSTNSSKPKEDAQRMAALLRFGSYFLGQTEEAPDQAKKKDVDYLGNVDDLPVYWTRNAEHLPVPQPSNDDLHYLPSPTPKHPVGTLTTIQEAIQDSTFAQNVNWLQAEAEAITHGLASGAVNAVEERKNTWQRNMTVISKWIQDAPL